MGAASTPILSGMWFLSNRKEDALPLAQRLLQLRLADPGVRSLSAAENVNCHRLTRI
jgi:hypothetical protein